MATQISTDQICSTADHRVMRLKRELRIEKEQHDRSIEALSLANQKIIAAERVLDALDACFVRLSGMTPAEYLEVNA